MLLTLFGLVPGLPMLPFWIMAAATGATGYGLAICAEVTQEFADIDLKGARVVVHREALSNLHRRGAVVHTDEDDLHSRIPTPTTAKTRPRP